MVALGDASITAAAKEGGVVNISHVDHTSTSVLFFFSKYCTEVWGHGARPAATAQTSAPAKANTDGATVK
jgi:hypothetical protein